VKLEGFSSEVEGMGMAKSASKSNRIIITVKNRLFYGVTFEAISIAVLCWLRQIPRQVGKDPMTRSGPRERLFRDGSLA
jgi:hypothetical protein